MMAMKISRHTKLLMLILLMFSGILYSTSFSSLISNVVINNTGQIAFTKVWASSGYAEDIQAAVDAVAAAGGGTVYVPEGVFNWSASSFRQTVGARPTGVIIPGGVNVIGAGMDKTIIQLIEQPPANSFAFAMLGDGLPIRVSGIYFKGRVIDEESHSSAIYICDSDNFRVDHCKFEDWDESAIYTRYEGGGHKGVIDHNIIDNPYKDTVGGNWAYGIIVTAYYNVPNLWKPIDYYLGKYVDNVVYIENNLFRRCRHSIASAEGGYYVVRYNTFEEPRPKNFGIIDVHGGDPGGRGLEAYNNTIKGAQGNGASEAFWIRGGGGCIFNNTMINISLGIGLYVESENPIYQVKDLYIWNNAMDGGALLGNYGDYTENVDYFLYAKPNYTPYQYPHPLTHQE